MRAQAARAGRRAVRIGRLILALSAFQVSVLLVFGWHAGAAAPPCDGPVAVPLPPPVCGTTPCLPNTGGGGRDEYCEANPTDPDCARPGGTSPTDVAGRSLDSRIGFRRALASIFVPIVGALAHRDEAAAIARQRNAPPCDPPTPTPVPLTPLPEPRGVASGLGGDIAAILPTFAMRANPTLGLVNLESWFWVEGYDGRDFSASASFSSPPYDGEMVVAVRCTPRRYSWDFVDSHGREFAGRGGGPERGGRAIAEHRRPHLSRCAPERWIHRRPHHRMGDRVER